MANVIAVGTVNPVELRLHKVMTHLPEDASCESIYKACLDRDVDTVYFNRRTLFVAGLNSNAEPLVLPGVSGFMAGKRHIRVFFPDRKKRYKLHGLLSDGVEAAPKKQEHISYSFFEDDHGGTIVLESSGTMITNSSPSPAPRKGVSPGFFLSNKSV